MKKTILFAVILVLIISSQCMGEPRAKVMTHGNDSGYSVKNETIENARDAKSTSDRNGHVVAAGIAGISTAAGVTTGLLAVGGGIAAAPIVVITAPAIAAAAAIGGLTYWLFSD